MKTIELKTFDVPSGEINVEAIEKKILLLTAQLAGIKNNGKALPTVEIKYKDLIIAAINSVPKKFDRVNQRWYEIGLSLDEIRERSRILNKIESNKKKKIDLDDIDVKIIRKLISEQKYTIVHIGFAEFGDYIASIDDGPSF